MVFALSRWFPNPLPSFSPFSTTNHTKKHEIFLELLLRRMSLLWQKNFVWQGLFYVIAPEAFNAGGVAP